MNKGELERHEARNADRARFVRRQSWEQAATRDRSKLRVVGDRAVLHAETKVGNACRLVGLVGVVGTRSERRHGLCATRGTSRRSD